MEEEKRVSRLKEMDISELHVAGVNLLTAK